MPSRPGPRKPGQSARRLRCCRSRRFGCRSASGCDAAPRAVSTAVAGAAGWRRGLRPSGVAAGADGSATGSSPAWARSRSSGVFVQRHVELRIVVAGDAFGPDERPHPASEQDGRGHRRAPRSIGEATAGHRPGDEGEAQDRDGVTRQSHSGPIDSWRRCHVATSATIIRTMAPKRSDQGARLKNSPPHDDSQRADESPRAPHSLMDPGTTAAGRTGPATAAPRRPRRATAGAASAESIRQSVR